MTENVIYLVVDGRKVNLLNIGGPLQSSARFYCIIIAIRYMKYNPNRHLHDD